MATYTGQSVTFELSTDGNSWHNFKEAMPKPTRTVNIRPYGNRWFLPHYQMEAEIDYLNYGTDEDMTTATLSMAGSNMRDLTDYSFRARALRWGYIRLWLPVLRLWTRLKRGGE